ncbi:MAG: hypothetical protein WDN04_22210 [Rhodospirillales bacterium]
MTAAALRPYIRRERLLVFSAATSLVFLLTGGAPLGSLSNPLSLAVIFVWLFATVLAPRCRLSATPINSPSGWANPTAR